MNKFLGLSDSDQEEAIRETAAQMRLHPTPIEKDFWVCYLLRELFALDCVKEHLIFKGGTSLSKAYGIIDRFSEDIDLSVHSSVFGIDLGTDFSLLNASQKRIRISQLYKTAARFMDDTFIPELRKRLEQSLPEKNWRLQPHRRGDDNNIILFKYKKLIHDTKKPHSSSPEVQIEIGFRAEHDPAENKVVQPYIAEQFPTIFEDPTTPLKVISASRTFWEKATIYHAELSKPSDQPIRKHYARHAYDLHQLLNSEAGQESLHDGELLKKVCEHKAHFHASTHVDYTAAHTGGLKVFPTGSRQEELAADYKTMRDFFMIDRPPPFEDILKSLKIIEQQTNSALP